MIVGRLAPSPTGLLHLGHARSFLLAWWSVRARGGRMVLRMEDLDAPRVRQDMIEAALADMEWLGLDWDGAIELQSSGVEQLRAAIASLVDRGLAYPCVCTRADLRAASAPHAGEGEVRYPGTCRGRFATRAAAGRAAGLRFVVPRGTVEIDDLVAGRVRFDVQAEVGDFLVETRSGIPSYQLAVVVDDARQGVTEVLRGDDLLPSAARQYHLQRALGLPHPVWAHVPLVTDAGGRRLAKRADDLALARLRAGGTDPRAVVSWAARSAGLEVDDRVRARDMLGVFSLERLPRAPVRVGPDTIASLERAR